MPGMMSNSEVVILSNYCLPFSCLRTVTQYHNIRVLSLLPQEQPRTARPTGTIGWQTEAPRIVSLLVEE